MLYRLTDTGSNEVLGTYSAASEREAKDAMARAYGYDDFVALLCSAPSVGHAVEAKAL